MQMMPSLGMDFQAAPSNMMSMSTVAAQDKENRDSGTLTQDQSTLLTDEMKEHIDRKIAEGIAEGLRNFAPDVVSDSEAAPVIKTKRKRCKMMIVSHPIRKISVNNLQTH
jgi:hypothetical protein